ncbi:protein-disulfide reductase DsbD family protein [Flavisolibacter ginsengisoli]|jgi:thiol:disulfide interchange protein DsbD|uniref:Thiol:disulfide interchange protein DsbD n=1 Tax=Flavisolibacter ginsengisoli DSM 18119 TaxID=1121884 RepID=A0A1M5CUU2_9BACT|nr:cytochrome c biogenesis protein CcdA [Flavisolibacter ginsengisoli]SHF58463.1 thiol:disulfide interchange protein DsbD [Flavisolibacter ginsengisoli DSM 18119]
MKAIVQAGLFIFFILAGVLTHAQDSIQPFKWNVSSKKISANQYQLIFSTTGNKGWDLYAPDQLLSEVPTTELQLSDSSIMVTNGYADSGYFKKTHSPLFDTVVKTYEGPATWKKTITFPGVIPGHLQGTLLYTYGRGEEFYPSTALSFNVSLEGGVNTTAQIKVPTIDLKNPVNNCGDDDTADKSLFSIFLLGFIGGLIALITPCVFPLIPLTVSFFTKKSGTRKKGIQNALLYGLSIFIIYALLSVPFHLLSSVNPEILNNISTNVWLNLTFFVVFIFFALSFFGLYEIGLPSGLASKIDSRAGMSNFWGIFFMALTLAIVSFSCTGPILGSLLAGVLTSDNGATQLTFGMSGFGLGLALPFALFALFPNWLQSLPKSGGWLNSVKVVLGFLELALAIKFLSNADLVKQWHLLEREVFIALWILIGIAIVLYLLGIIRFGHDSKPRFSKTRVFFIALFGLFTLYLVPGVTNTKWARLTLISGFPPPYGYSIYQHPVNYETGVEPLHNQYAKALQMAREQNKPVLIDFTGWACVNCRRMEENVWTNEEVKELMKNDFIVVSLYVDERQQLPASEQFVYNTKSGTEKPIITVGDKWATFQSENFNAVSQPQYAIISADEVALTKTKAYTPSAGQFRDWLKCGLDAYKKSKK